MAPNKGWSSILFTFRYVLIVGIVLDLVFLSTVYLAITTSVRFSCFLYYNYHYGVYKDRGRSNKALVLFFDQLSDE